MGRKLPERVRPGNVHFQYKHDMKTKMLNSLVGSIAADPLPHRERPVTVLTRHASLRDWRPVRGRKPPFNGWLYSDPLNDRKGPHTCRALDNYYCLGCRNLGRFRFFNGTSLFRLWRCRKRCEGSMWFLTRRQVGGRRFPRIAQ